MRYLLLVVLGCLLALGVVFDVHEADRIYRKGFPPIDFYDPGFVVVTATPKDRVQYGLILVASGLAQVFIVWAMLRLWRRPKP